MLKEKVLVKVKEENLIAKLKSVKNNFFILEGFTEKINYVFEKEKCEYITDSVLKTNISDIGYDSFYKKLVSDYNKIKNDIFTKKYKLNKNNKPSKSFLEKLNTFLAYKSCYDSLTENEIEKIINLCNIEEIKEIPYITINNEIKGISAIHFYKYIIGKLFESKKQISVKCLLPEEYYNKLIKEYYNFFSSNI